MSSNNEAHQLFVRPAAETSSIHKEIADLPRSTSIGCLRLGAKGERYAIAETLDWKYEGPLEAYLVHLVADGSVEREPPKRETLICADHIHVGIDTEYVERCDGDSRWNDVISVQLWFVELNRGIFLVMPRGRRKKTRFSDLVKFVDEFCRKRLPRNRCRYNSYRFISHFSRAEFQAGLDIIEDTKDGWLRLDVRGKGLVSAFGPSKLIYHDANRNRREAEVCICDTCLLSPGSLDTLARDIGTAKVSIPQDAVSQIDVFFNEHFDAYLDYSMHDAFICCRWFVEAMGVVSELLPDEERAPVTASQMSQWFIASRIDSVQERLCGRIKTKRFDKEGGYRTTLKLRKHLLEEGRQAYYGGRNEVFRVGVFPGPAFDYDLTSAYPTSVLCLQDVDWNYPEPFKLEDIAPNDVGYARVRFRFKSSVRFPMFPIEDSNGHGLIFPVSGVTTVTIPELWTATKNNMLDVIEILGGAR